MGWNGSFWKSNDQADKGFFLDPAALAAAWPTGQAGWHAIVGTTDTVWVWDTGTGAWVDSSKQGTGDVVGPAGATSGNVPVFSGVSGKLLADGGVALANILQDAMRFIIDGGGFAIQAGAYIDLPARFAANIVGFQILNTNKVGASDQIAIEVQKCTTAQYDGGVTHPVTGDKISASVPITFASAGDAINTVSTLTGWSTAIAAGDILRFYVNTAVAITNATVILKLQRV